MKLHRASRKNKLIKIYRILIALCIFTELLYRNTTTKIMQVKRYIIAIIIIVVSLPGWLLLSEWRPRGVEREFFDVESVLLKDTLTLVSWNIGYGGLGENMDFFYDGGVKTRASKRESRENMKAIVAQLREFQGVDFILLQEVDLGSKRSYWVDQLQYICEALDYEFVGFALNYNSRFVPIPLNDPMGRVKSGVVILSKHQFAQSIRWQYPSIPQFPNRLFDLKRAMLSVVIPTHRGDTLWINNTHNSAFDSGEMRRREVAFIGDRIASMPYSVTAGDWNCTPPGYTPSKESLANRYFSPLPLHVSELPRGVTMAADLSKKSMRYLNTPYVENETTTSVVDFAILGQKTTLVECKILDLKFKNSDHNPIFVTFVY